MSARNGDKARFGKQRKRRMAQRLKVRALREELKPAGAAPAEESMSSEAEAHHEEHHGVLGTAAGSIGAALGSLAAKVKGLKHPEPATAE